MRETRWHCVVGQGDREVTRDLWLFSAFSSALPFHSLPPRHHPRPTGPLPTTKPAPPRPSNSTPGPLVSREKPQSDHRQLCSLPTQPGSHQPADHPLPQPDILHNPLGSFPWRALSPNHAVLTSHLSVHTLTSLHLSQSTRALVTLHVGGTQQQLGSKAPLTDPN